MRSGLRHIATVLLVALCLCSCGREGRIIPRSKLARIYAEMFVADNWLSSTASGSARMRADTTAFYDPIFKAHGYTVEDYWASVSHYLQDPDRFSRILKKSGMMLDAELKEIEKAIDKAAENEEAMKKYRPGKIVKHVFDLYGAPFSEAVVTDRLDISRDPSGRFVPNKIVVDTMYFGPRMIVAADTLKAVADTLEVAVDSLEVAVEPVVETVRNPRGRSKRRVLEEPVR